MQTIILVIFDKKVFSISLKELFLEIKDSI